MRLLLVAALLLAVGAPGAAAGRSRKARPKSHSAPRSVLPVFYLGGQGYLNMGDDLLYEIFVRHLAGHLAEHTGYAPAIMPIHPNPPCHTSVYDFSQHQLVVIGGGSILSEDWLCSIEAAMTRPNTKYLLWGSGVDDHNMATEDADLRAKVRAAKKIVPIAESSVPYLELLLGTSPLGGVRGPYTESALASIVPDNSADVLLDAGLLAAAYYRLPFVGKVKDALAWVGRRSPAFAGFSDPRRPLVVVNYGRPIEVDRLYGRDQQAVQRNLAAAIETIAQTHNVVVYPIFPGDITEVEGLAAATGAAPGAVYALSFVPDVSEILGLLAAAEYSINFKLHASVLAAAAAKPYLSLAYRWKCIEFADSIKLGAYVLPTSEASTDAILAQVDLVRRNSDAIVAACEVAIDKAKERYADALTEYTDMVLAPAPSSAAGSASVRVLHGVYYDRHQYLNLGPQAAFDVANRMIVSAFAERGIVVTLIPAMVMDTCDAMLRDPQLFDFVVLGSSSMLPATSVACTLQPYVDARKPILTLGTGFEDFFADEARADIFSNPGAQLNSPVPAILGRMTVATLRGPFTHALMTNSAKGHVDPTKVTQIASPALFVPDVLGETTEVADIARKFVAGLGIADDAKTLFANIAHVSPGYGPEFSQLAGQLAAPLCDLVRDHGWTVVFFPMTTADIGMGSQMASNVPRIGNCDPDAFANAGIVFDASITVEILRRATAVLAMRMHASVLSAAAETPFVSLATRFKQLDMDAALGMSQYTMRADHLDTAALVQRIVQLGESEERDRVSKHLQDVRADMRQRMDKAIGTFVGGL